MKIIVVLLGMMNLYPTKGDEDIVGMKERSAGDEDIVGMEIRSAGDEEIIGMDKRADCSCSWFAPLRGCYISKAAPTGYACGCTDWGWFCKSKVAKCPKEFKRNYMWIRGCDNTNLYTSCKLYPGSNCKGYKDKSG